MITMSTVAVLRSIPEPTLAPVSKLQLHPRISLEFCEWCHGLGRFTCGRHVLPCTQCNGRGSIVTDNGAP